jgi:mono/diheme cytochrome c family protein
VSARTALRAAALLLAIAAAACGGRAAAPAEPSAPASALPCASRSGLPTAAASTRLLEGARVFDERCTPCHGETGHGDGVLAELLPIRPRNYHADPFKWGTSWEAIEETVRLGRSDVMPSFAGALTQEEMRSVAFLVACWVAQRDVPAQPSR